MTTSAPQAERPRPSVITVIGWFFIITGILAVFSIISFSLNRSLFSTMGANLGIDLTAVALTTCLTGAFYGLTGFAVLKGFAWGRKVFIIFGLVSVTLSIIIYHEALFMIIPSVLYYGIFTWLLTRDTSNEWFEGTYEPEPEERDRRQAVAAIRSIQRSTNPVRQIFAILLAMIAGFLFAMSLFMFGIAPPEGKIAMILFFAIPALFFLAAGIFLWGPGRWASFSGWTVTISGIWAVFSGASILILMHTTMWSTLSTQMQNGDVTISVNNMASILLAGIFAIILGIGLINHQYKLDDAAAYRLKSGIKSLNEEED